MKRIDKPPSLSGVISAQLRQEIHSGRLMPAALIPSEARLCEQFGVSRAVVREAMAHLKAEGLIRSHQGKGAFVADPEHFAAFRVPAFEEAARKELADALQLRAVVEIGAAELAAIHRTTENLEAMSSALARMDVSPGLGDDGPAADVTFHFAIAEASGNPHLPNLLHYLQSHLTKARRSAWINSQRLGLGHDPAQNEHRAIYEAIAAGNSAQAGTAMREHLKCSARRLGLEMAGQEQTYG